MEMAENQDPFEACQRLMNSKHLDRVPIVHVSVFFTLMNFEGAGFKTAVHEMDECAISLASLRDPIASQAVAAHLGQLQKPQNAYQWFMVILSKGFVILSGRLDFRPERLWTHCNSLTLYDPINLSTWTGPGN
jgi:hypothetical protein